MSKTKYSQSPIVLVSLVVLFATDSTFTRGIGPLGPATAEATEATSPDTLARLLQAARALDNGERKADALFRIATAETAAKRLDEARAGLREALRAVENLGPHAWKLHERIGIDDWTVHPHLLIRIAVAQYVAGDREGARATLKEAAALALKQDRAVSKLELLQGVLAAQVATDDRPTAEETLRVARGIAQPLTGGTAVLASMSLARMEADLGDVNGALRRISAARPEENIDIGYYVSSTLRGIVESAANRGRPEDRKLITAIARAAAGVAPSSRKASVLEAVAAAQAKMGDFNAALQTARGMEEMIAAGLEALMTNSPKALALQEIAQAQIRSGARDAARATLREALQVAQRSLEIDRGNADSLGMLTHIAMTQVEAGDLDGALQTAQIRDSSSNAQIVAAVARAQSQAGDRDAAAQNYAAALKLLEGGLFAAGNQFVKDFVSANFASIQAERGDIDGALRTAREVKSERQSERAVTAIACTQAECGDIPGVLKWAAKLESSELRAAAIDGAAEGWARSVRIQAKARR